jgi:hypothetical protein
MSSRWKGENVMKNVVAAAAAVIVLLAGGSLLDAAEKKKTKKAPPKTAPTATVSAPEQAQPPKLPAGYQEVRTGAPELARAAYRIDGRSIMVFFQNISRDKAIRIKYQVRWKANRNGKWVDDASLEGISFRLKKQEDLTREVRTANSMVKDVVIDVTANEAD